MTGHDTIDERALELARQLIRRRSITPDDAGCQSLLGDYLGAAGFDCRHQRFGEVDNLWAHHGTSRPLLVLLGHTDVVPPGPEANWRYPPFDATLAEGMLWGRGAADMKGSVAAMVEAAAAFAREQPDHPGSIAILLTSDEEGPARDGIRRMMQWLDETGEGPIDYCIVGEPSADSRIGDTIRTGRRGTLTGRLRVNGRQGHVAYATPSDNPVHRLVPALTDLTRRVWDEGDEEFPATSFQISNLHAGTGADNVVPGTADVTFNFRYGTRSSADDLRQGVRSILDGHGLDYELEWHHGGEPFVTAAGTLRTVLTEAIASTLDMHPATSTGGGTSDARFVAPTGAEVVEFGPCNASIHQIDEHVPVAEIGAAARVHLALARRLLGAARD